LDSIEVKPITGTEVEVLIFPFIDTLPKNPNPHEAKHIAKTPVHLIHKYTRAH
jgi:hypothetical protein